MSILPMYIQGANASKINDISSYSFMFTQEELIAGSASNEAASQMFINKLGDRITVNRFAENACTVYNYGSGFNFEYGYANYGSVFNYCPIVFNKVPLPKKLSLKLYYPSNIRSSSSGVGYGYFTIYAVSSTGKFGTISFFLFNVKYSSNDAYTYFRINNDQTYIARGTELNNAESTLDGEWNIDHSLFDESFKGDQNVSIYLYSPNYYYNSSGAGGTSAVWCPIIQRFGMTF